MPDNPSFWVVVYSTLEKLEEGCADLGMNKEFIIKNITDGRSFIEDIRKYNIRIMLDPYTLKVENVTRWTEVVLEEEWQK